MSTPHPAPIRRIAQCALYRDYASAFSTATGLPLTLADPGRLIVADSEAPSTSPLRKLLGPIVMDRRQLLDLGITRDTKRCAPRTRQLLGGLTDTEIPIHVGDHLAGYLITGDVLLREPTEAEFVDLTHQVARFGLRISDDHLRHTIKRTRIIPTAKYEAMIELLVTFAEHLETIASQIIRLEESNDSPQLRRARQYIQAHQSDPIHLREVARIAHMSPYYFCKQFKRFTGMSFTTYVGSIRVARAKQLLLNREARITEVAFDAGFQSLTHFNRLFRKFVGASPSQYRANIMMKGKDAAPTPPMPAVQSMVAG